jgi:hypothetical protein
VVSVTVVPVPCPAGRFENPAGVRFCGVCGARLIAVPDARLQETLLASEPVARLRDEARTLGVTR